MQLWPESFRHWIYFSPSAPTNQCCNKWTIGASITNGVGHFWPRQSRYTRVLRSTGKLNFPRQGTITFFLLDPTQMALFPKQSGGAIPPRSANSFFGYFTSKGSVQIPGCITATCTQQGNALSAMPNMHPTGHCPTGLFVSCVLVVTASGHSPTSNLVH